MRKVRLGILCLTLLFLSNCAVIDIVGGGSPREQAAVIIKTGYHLADSYYGGVLQNYKWAEDAYAATPSAETGESLEYWKERQKEAGRLYATFEGYHATLMGLYNNAESSDDLIDVALDQVLKVLNELQRKSVLRGG